MICIVIKGPSYLDAFKQISQAIHNADLIELRLDCFESIDFDELRSLRSSFSIPMIFTIRCKQQGGNYHNTEKERLHTLKQLATLEPEYLDLENTVPQDIVEEITSKHSKIKIILSYHDFSKTPDDLNAILHSMQKTKAAFYKIAVMAQSSNDALQLLCWAKKTPENVIAISMGIHGQISRILVPIIGGHWTYATLDDDQQTAPGQLTASTLIERYNYRSLTPSTHLLGLIGDPVSLSVSDITHNALMHSFNLNSVYIKMVVKPEELQQFLQLAKELPFLGLSVTMPLKEHIIPLIDSLENSAKNIGAVNTLQFTNGKIKGYNTDALGALNALESFSKVKGKRLVIIGAGGSAKAIAYEAVQRGALVTIVNRDKTKAEKLSKTLSCNAVGIDEMSHCAQNGYDILINSTPSDMPIDSIDILPHTFVMDIKTRPLNTTLLNEARKKGCHIVYGYRMFVEQAVAQFHIWFHDAINLDDIKTELQNSVEKTLKG